jgi:hypothetical protein
MASGNRQQVYVGSFTTFHNPVNAGRSIYPFHLLVKGYTRNNLSSVARSNGDLLDCSKDCSPCPWLYSGRLTERRPMHEDRATKAYRGDPGKIAITPSSARCITTVDRPRMCNVFAACLQRILHPWTCTTMHVVVNTSHSRLGHRTGSVYQVYTPKYVLGNR